MDLEKHVQYRRINVVGTSGSGKSTVSRMLAEILDLPHHEMDALFWKPNWEQSSDEELLQKVRDIVSADEWVIDGNYTRTIPEKWKRVQLVVWLDLSFTRTVFRVTKRAVRRSLAGNELWPGTGNRENLAQTFFSRKSVIWWAMKTYGLNRKRYDALMTAPEYAHIPFVRLTSPRMVASYLEGLRKAAEQDGRRVGRAEQR